MKELLDKPAVKTLIAAISVLSPIKAALATVLVLVLSDLVLGILAAKKRGEKISSSGLRRTITKLFVYQSAIILAYISQKYLMGDMMPLSNLVSSFIGLTEIKSIIENLNVIGDGKLLSGLLEKLNSQSKKE